MQSLWKEEHKLSQKLDSSEVNRIEFDVLWFLNIFIIKNFQFSTFIYWPLLAVCFSIFSFLSFLSAFVFFSSAFCHGIDSVGDWVWKMTGTFSVLFQSNEYWEHYRLCTCGWINAWSTLKYTFSYNMWWKRLLQVALFFWAVNCTLHSNCKIEVSAVCQDNREILFFMWYSICMFRILIRALFCLRLSWDFNFIYI